MAGPCRGEQLVPAGEIELAPGLVDDHGRCVGEIQTAAAGLHGQAQTLPGRQGFEHRLGKTAGLGPKQQGITGLEPCLIVAGVAARGNGEDPVGPHRFPPLFEAVILLHPSQLVIIEPGAARPRAVQLEAERMDQVQRSAGIGCQTNDVPGVRRDLRLKEDDVKHE